MDAYDWKHRLRHISLLAATLLVNLCRGIFLCSQKTSNNMANLSMNGCDLCDVGNIMRVVQHNATAQLGPLNNL